MQTFTLSFSNPTLRCMRFSSFSYSFYLSVYSSIHFPPKSFFWLSYQTIRIPYNRECSIWNAFVRQITVIILITNDRLFMWKLCSHLCKFVFIIYKEIVYWISMNWLELHQSKPNYHNYSFITLIIVQRVLYLKDRIFHRVNHFLIQTTNKSFE